LSTTSSLHSLVFIVLQSLFDPLQIHFLIVSKHWDPYLW